VKVGASAIPCGVCGAPLPAAAGEGIRAIRCPACGRPHTVELFPAFWRGLAGGEAARPVALPDQAACFYHPSSQAAAVCDGCGRFLCALCLVSFHGRSLCPACIQAGFRKRTFQNLDSRRILYDDIALGLALIPLLAWPLTALTAPAALFVAIRYWRTPSSLIPRSRARRVAAMVLALFQIAGWLTAAGFLVHLALNA
jgi:hypothetical protein